MKIELRRVRYMPRDLDPGVLCVSEEFGAAAHLCPCGCGTKVRTPLGPTDWTLQETDRGPTLYPSVGNWQQSCQSHYWIDGGEIVWAKKWSPEQIAAGYKAQEEREHAYYTNNRRGGNSIASKVWHWLRSIAR
jgi:hypothetical protein